MSDEYLVQAMMALRSGGSVNDGECRSKSRARAIV